jgi:3-deoxy-D-manno-octulosonic-acid transferase
MARFFYTALFYSLLPLVLARLLWRSRKAPDYRRRWQERLGFYDAPSAGNVVWFHAVSVGEVEAAVPLIRLLQQQYPQQSIVVTTTTPTGSNRLRQLMADSVEHVYLPYDVPWVIGRFLRHFRPRLAVFLEKELWPNLFAACAARQIPLCVVNARLSSRSAAAYRNIPWLVKPALAAIAVIAAQTEQDSQQFLSIGASAEQLQVLGNSKFDVALDDAVRETGQQLKQTLWPQRFVWIVASSHHGEEALLLDHYAALKARIPNLLLVIAPRHPERFAAVKALCQARQLPVVMRSAGGPVDDDCAVYVADSMGELKPLYAASDVAFVGGSLVPVGGHNVLEPAVMGVPVVFGPAMFNFQLIAERMLVDDAAVQCADAAAVADGVMRLYADVARRQQLVANAKAFVVANQGATARIVAALSRYL